jgi:excisionase family DNA binding protein
MHEHWQSPAQRLARWTTRDVADFLRVHPKTVERYVRLYGLPCCRLGGRYRFDPVQVARWLESRKEGVT